MQLPTFSDILEKFIHIRILNLLFLYIICETIHWHIEFNITK